MKLVNLTPHDIMLYIHETSTTIAPSGNVARVITHAYPEPTIMADIHDDAHRSTIEVPVHCMHSVAIDGLPQPHPDVLYIVSTMVAQHCSERHDVVAPDTGDSALRDEQGIITAVRGFVRFVDDISQQMPTHGDMIDIDDFDMDIINSIWRDMADRQTPASTQKKTKKRTKK